MNLNINRLAIYPWGRFLLPLVVICAASLTAAGQDFSVKLSVEELQLKAERNYPAAKQYGLIEQSRDFTLANASKGYLPQLGLNARATYQSEVTQLPAAMPGVFILNMPAPGCTTRPSCMSPFPAWRLSLFCSICGASDATMAKCFSPAWAFMASSDSLSNSGAPKTRRCCSD